MLTTLTTAWHQHAKGIRVVGAWLGAALLLLAAVLASLPELGVTQVQLELLSWGGGALGGAVLLPEARRALGRWASTGGGVLLIVAAQMVTTHWPASPIASFAAALLMGVAGLAKGWGAVVRPDVARASTAHTAPND